ncbi:MAG: polyphosphate polymerase domain-containing protein [Verrucomicrobiae bacterium]|nr:polyphosphate polymerase domain-containing protein [Verrucomicrobiae bacterium]
MAGESDPGVTEVKFPLTGGAVEPVLEWLRRHCRPDPHGSGVCGDEYLVQSVYCDTAGYDVFHRRGSYGRAKFRVRRYGDGAGVFLERKLKRSGVVRKRRVAVPEASLALLGARLNGTAWEGAWFQHRLALRGLHPVVRMCYQRVARVGETAEGPLRMTLDRGVRAEEAGGWGPPRPLQGRDLLEGRGVLEVKFRGGMPAMVKALIEEWNLVPGPLSKYRLGVRACGLATEEAGDPGRELESSHVP